MSPKISIIILNWNGLTDTRECIKSVQEIRYPNFDIIIVDNGSTDESVKTLRQEFPDIHLIETGKNLGYAEGNNVGMRYALEKGADFLLVLNNDTTVAQDLLTQLVKAANEYPDAGVFSPRIYYHSQPDLIFCAGTSWDPVRHVFDHIGCGKKDGEAYSSVRETEYACGCAIFFRRDVADKIGLFDPEFFLCYEETDWCFRAKRAGYKILYIPWAKLWHKISVSFGGVSSPLVVYYLTRNRFLWAKKNVPAGKRFAYYFGAIKDLFDSVSYATKYPLYKRIYWDLINLKSSEGQAKLIGIRDFILGRYGNGNASVAGLMKKK